jgi:acyl-CoA thioester hydrolase
VTVLVTHVERRFKDLDPLGHVNNVVYLDYLQEARLRALRQVGYREIENFTQVMAHQSIDYRQPIFYSTEPLIIEVWISAVGNSSYRMKYRILNDNGEVAAEAESVMVCFDNGKAVPIPSGLRAALEAIAELE